jgi:hypothetical protein
MTLYRALRALGLLLIILWATVMVVTLSALAGIEAAESSEAPTPAPSWVAR